MPFYLGRKPRPANTSWRESVYSNVNEADLTVLQTKLFAAVNSVYAKNQISEDLASSGIAACREILGQFRKNNSNSFATLRNYFDNSALQHYMQTTFDHKHNYDGTTLSQEEANRLIGEIEHAAKAFIDERTNTPHDARGRGHY